MLNEKCPSKAAVERNEKFLFREQAAMDHRQDERAHSVTCDKACRENNNHWQSAVEFECRNINVHVSLYHNNRRRSARADKFWWSKLSDRVKTQRIENNSTATNRCVKLSFIDSTTIPAVSRLL